MEFIWYILLQNCEKCSFKGLGPSKNPKFSFLLDWCLILSKNQGMCKFLLILHDPNAQKQFLAFSNQAPIMVVVIFWDLFMFYKILFLPQVIWLLVLKTVYVVRCAILCNLKNVENTHEGVLILTKINTLPWVFFTFLKLYKWYQIAQRITYMSCLTSCKRLKT